MEASITPQVSLSELQLALETSWDPSTAYLAAHQPGNAALGQCYPTSRVVQWFFPNLEIAFGEVDTVTGLENHFWNIDLTSTSANHIDLTWQQFAEGSEMTGFKVLDRLALNDSRTTIARCELLLERVLTTLQTTSARALWPEQGND